MKNRFTLFLLSALIIGGCSTPSLNTSVDENTGIFSGTTLKSVDLLVEKKRLENNLAVLTGKSPLSDGNLISERGTPEGKIKSRNYISSRLEEFGYKVERHNYRKNGENIFTRLLANENSSEYILLGAHFDSVRNAGANDNGTGSAAILEAARVLKQLEGRKVNIIFAWFDEEELGLVGSEAMAREFKKQGLKITSVHTIDMLGWDADKDGVIEIEQPDGVLWDYYKMVNEKHQLKIRLSRTSSGSTDHVAFREEGYQAVGLCEEWAGGDTTPYYHKKTDTYDTVNFDILFSGTKLLVDVAGDLSLKVPPPSDIRILPHNQFPGRERVFNQFVD